ncbi:MAG: inositol monophosphatase family protein [Candidatus Melainabacteria bacterium]
MTPPVQLGPAIALELAVKASRAAGAHQMAHFGQVLEIHTKSNANDLVTQVDTACDAMIRAMLTEGAPGVSLLTEETYTEGDAMAVDHAWIVDPLDGTNNYAHAFPHFAVSIAYVVQGQVQAGVVFDPFKNELFTALRGHGARLNDRPLRVTGCTALPEAILATGFPYDTGTNPDNNLTEFVALRRQIRGVRRVGAAALDLAYTAAGRLDGFWELRLSSWDVAAGLLLVQEAGGVVSDYAGQPIDLSQRRINILAAATPALGEAIADVLNA